jgi:hypothetical protein
MTRGVKARDTDWDLLSDLTVAFILEYNNVDVSGDCWEVQARRSTRGYGWICYKGQVIRSHRAMYFVSTGHAPVGLEVTHSCDNPPCVRPQHLKAKTHAGNMRDMSVRRRRHGKATGKQNGKHTQPKSRATGDRNGARLYPERLARGDRHPFRINPQLQPRGSQNGMSKDHPSRVMGRCLDCGLVSTASGVTKHSKSSGHQNIEKFKQKDMESKR